MATPVPVEKKATPAPASADPWRSFRDEMDRMFDRFSGAFGLPAFRRMFDVEPGWRSGGGLNLSVPAVDVSETDQAYTIAAELPGMDEQSIDVSLSGDLLTLKGEKREETEQKDKNYYVSERSYGSFQRAFRVPEGIDRDKIAATFSKGVLTITLPKTAEAQQQQKKIDVKAD